MNMNAIAERFVQSVKRECLERLILFGADHLQRALKEFVDHKAGLPAGNDTKGELVKTLVLFLLQKYGIQAIATLLPEPWKTFLVLNGPVITDLIEKAIARKESGAACGYG